MWLLAPKKGVITLALVEAAMFRPPESTLSSQEMSLKTQLWPNTSKDIEWLIQNQKSILNQGRIICGMRAQQRQQQSKQRWLMMKRRLYTNLHGHANWDHGSIKVLRHKYWCPCMWQFVSCFIMLRIFFFIFPLFVLKCLDISSNLFRIKYESILLALICV